MEHVLPLPKDMRPVTQSGLFVGTEVEETPFVGMPTLFVARNVSRRELKGALQKRPLVKHIYFGVSVNAPRLSAGVPLVRLMRALLFAEYKVTLDIRPDDPLLRRPILTQMRQKFPKAFLLMLNCSIPRPAVGLVTVKLEPTTIYNTKESLGVFVAYDFKLTPWSAYSGDEEV